MLDAAVLIRKIIGPSQSGRVTPAGTYARVSGELEQKDEHHSNHARRMGRPQEYPARAKWPRTVPMVLVGSAVTPIHLLLRLLRTRVEAALSARVLARADIAPR
jgi:hypothetical protein